MSNVFKTGFLLAVLTVMLVLLGGAFGGRQGMLIAFVIALLMNLVSYWFSDKMVLAAYGAQPIDEAAAPRLYAIVHRLATRAGIPMPRVYLIPSETPNAFATGRNPEHAAGAGARDFRADATGARVAGKPGGPAKALEKLQMANEAAPMANATPATAHLFIVNPLSGQTLMRLFSTHPPLEERIARLRAMRI